MFPRNVMLYGKTEPLPDARVVRAGPLTAIYENGDLRNIRLGEHEIIRRVYSAVRDHNWSTILPVLSNVQIEETQNSFNIQYDVENHQGNIHFVWHGNISGTANGTIRFSMNGQALSTFVRNRIGFCILHPIACAGARARIKHVDGSIDETQFPVFIAPQEIVDGRIKPVSPFAEMRLLSHEVTPGVWADLYMEGDIFELEDQRNWLDASYKTYCTPLRLPFPVEVSTGTHIEQVLTLRIRGSVDTMVSSAAPDPSVILSPLPNTGKRKMPSIGLDSASHGHPLTAEQIKQLKTLNLSHLRVMIDMTAENYAARLQQANTEAQALGIPLEIALSLSHDTLSDASAFSRLIEGLGANVVRIIVLRTGELVTSAASVRAVRKYIANIPLIGGTDANFCELNREQTTMPDLVSGVDGLIFSINPQVHAFDNASVVETLVTIAAMVATARDFGGGKPISIGPITFKMRSNPYATAAPKPTPPGQLPLQVDPRQMSLFGAAWTLGCLAELATSDVESATFYETTGWRGVIDTDAGTLPVEPPFHSVPNMTFPLYHVLADIGEFRGGDAQSLVSSDAQRVIGLSLYRDGRTRWLVANLSAQPQPIQLPVLAQDSQMRVLDETNFELATRTPKAYRAQYEILPASTTRIVLTPFAVVCISTL